MMFVTADDFASVEKKRGVPGLKSNGAEEWLKEVVMVVKAEIQMEKVHVGGQQIISTTSKKKKMMFCRGKHAEP